MNRSTDPSRPGHARIVIAGPSCSGKSTVARLLSARMGARLLCLDDYYVRGHARRTVIFDGREYRSMEHPAAYDGAALLADMSAHPGPVVAEGFLLLRYEGAIEAAHVAAFVDVPWDVSLSRRHGRPTQCRADVNAAFEAVGASEWAEFGAIQGSLPGVVALDGRGDPHGIAAAIEARLAATFTVP